MSFVKKTSYVVTVEIVNVIPDYVIDSVSDIITSQGRVCAIKYLREEFRNNFGLNISLRDAKNIVEDVIIDRGEEQ